MSHSTEFRRALASPPSRPRVDLEEHPLPASDVRRAAARPQPPRAGGQPAPSNPKRDRKRPRDDFTPEDDEAILRRAAEAAEAKSGQPWRRAAEKLFPGRGFSDKDLRERYKYLSIRKRAAMLPRSVVEEARFLARIRVVRLGVEWEGDFPKKVEDECGNIPMVLVQNKIDLISKAEISSYETERIASDNRMKLYRTSVKEDLNVDLVFQHLAENYIKKVRSTDSIDSGFHSLNIGVGVKLFLL